MVLPIGVEPISSSIPRRCCYPVKLKQLVLLLTSPRQRRSRDGYLLVLHYVLKKTSTTLCSIERAPYCFACRGCDGAFCSGCKHPSLVCIHEYLRYALYCNSNSHFYKARICSIHHPLAAFTTPGDSCFQV